MKHSRTRVEGTEPRLGGYIYTLSKCSPSTTAIFLTNLIDRCLDSWGGYKPEGGINLYGASGSSRGS